MRARPSCGDKSPRRRLGRTYVGPCRASWSCTVSPTLCPQVPGCATVPAGPRCTMHPQWEAGVERHHLAQALALSAVSLKPTEEMGALPLCLPLPGERWACPGPRLCPHTGGLRAARGARSTSLQPHATRATWAEQQGNSWAEDRQPGSRLGPDSAQSSSWALGCHP